MELKIAQTRDTDILVIGGGAAGLRAAIEARKHGVDVVLISESLVGFRNNSMVSASAIAASGIRKEPSDSPEVHFRDTITAGCFLNDRKLVEILTRGATQQVHDLIEFGVDFVKSDGDISVWQIPGHTYPRTISAEEFRGVNITRPMRQYAASIGTHFIEGILVTKLLLAEDTVAGALGIDNKGQALVINAKFVILATGGAGHLYLRTNNAIGLTGDGYALAYEAGAALRDMELVQFYPITLGKHGSKLCLYERLIPRGATIMNSLGEDILKRHGIDDFVSATRDKVARLIMTEILEGRDIDGSVIFDLSAVPQHEAREFYHGGQFGEVHVAPAAHFFMGGVTINENGETSIDGLYAAGEVCGGVHGANRLGSNALAETLVFGALAGNRAAARALKMKRAPLPGDEVAAEVERLNELASGSDSGSLDELQQSLKQTMWNKVGIIRDKQSLEDAQGEVVALREHLRSTSVTDFQGLFRAVKLANMLTVAEMVCKASLFRTESRGAFYRTDYPEEDNEQWLKTIEIRCQSGEMVLRAVQVADPTA